MKFSLARRIADAVLYEGYMLYPYRASAAKNRFRWQFGVVAPRAWSESSGGDPWEMQTECLIEPHGSPTLDVTVRFLQPQVRTAEGGVPWEEGAERTIELTSLSLDALVCSGQDAPFDTPGTGGDFERWPISGVIRLAAEARGAVRKGANSR